MGSGYSLNKWPVEYFRHRPTIGVNEVIMRYAEVLDYYVIVDRRCPVEWKRRGAALGRGRFWVYETVPGVMDTEAVRFGRVNGTRFIREDCGALGTGASVIFTATNLAIVKGGQTIYLYGADFGYCRGRLHYRDKLFDNKFDGAPIEDKRKKELYHKMEITFNRVSARNDDIKIIRRT